MTSIGLRTTYENRPEGRWRNDINSHERAQFGDGMVYSKDVIEEGAVWTLIICHVISTSGRKGFMPQITIPGFGGGSGENGAYYYGIDDATYRAAIAAGRRLLRKANEEGERKYQETLRRQSK